jgi:glycosyltransferase involved in cell wall biosynthesis
MMFAGLRIGLVGPLPPPAGGMANQTRQLARLLGEGGAQTFVVQTNAPYRPAWVGNVRGMRAAFRLIPYLVALWRAAGQVDLLHVMANSGWSWHLFAAPALRIARLRGIPAVVNYRGGEAAEFLRASAASVRAALHGDALLAVPSGFLQEVFGRHGMRAEIIPNIVDLERFRPGPALPRVSAAPQLVVARNLEAIYGNDIAIRALPAILAACPGARLTIAGSGPELAVLTRLAAEQGVADAVCFTGRLDPDAMAALYREADLVLNPTRVDNMPNSVLEAMASGVPVISSAVGGVPFVIQDGVTGLLVRPDDARALADAAISLLNDAPRRAALREHALAEVARYAWGEVAPLWRDAYRRLIARGRGDLAGVAR